MKTILVTGSNGFLGSNLVKALAAERRYDVIGAVKDFAGFTDRYVCGEYLRTVTNNELFTADVDHVDLVVNCAFARSNDAFLLANALDFTARLTKALKKSGVGALINISSQGVYKRLPANELQTEASAIEPIDLYSMAKYAAERMLIVSECAPYITNVRLASINMKQRFLFAFVKKIVAGEKIILTAPYQNAALLDIQDAVSGLQALIDLPDDARKTIYNLGNGSQMTILDYAQIAVETMKEFGYSGEIILNNTDTRISNSGMDCSSIMHDTSWKPSVTVADMVREYGMELSNGGIKQ